MAAAKKTKTKLFMADELGPAATPTGESLEEQMNAFLATIANSDILNVSVTTSKSGQYGQNSVFAGSVLYLGA